MKTKLFFTALFLLFICLNVMPACQSDKKIAVKELPAPAQVFIQKYFSLDSVKMVTMDVKEKDYEVKFLNRSEVSFDSEGMWTEVDTKKNPFPIALFDTLPANIFQYIIKNHPKKPVTSISKKTYGYEVEVGIAKDLDLKFDKDGNLIKEKK